MSVIYTTIRKRNRHGKMWAVIADGVPVIYCATPEEAVGLL